MPKQHFVKNIFLDYRIFGRLVEQAPISFHLSLFLSLFLTVQTPSEDDFSEDEWLKPLPP